ncbi:MAG: TGS domain-containing protein, partial [Spirochaetota bacterium]
MSTVAVTLPDGSRLSAEKGTTIYDIIGQIGAGLQKAAVAATLNNAPADLGMPVNEDSTLIVHTFRDETGRDIYWHSTSHMLAQAVMRLYPQAQYTIGPAIENGFYYDFDIDINFSPDDLEKIEEEMKKIRSEAHAVQRSVLSRSEAVDFFAQRGQNYKVELINEFPDDTVSIYSQGEFADLCRGPHVQNTADIKEFKLTKVAGAYWRGDEKNKMLQRIYGISFPDKKQLKEYLAMIEEAKERDHRKIGRELSLYDTAQEIGPGLILWTPKGGRIRSTIEDFWRREHYRNG